MRTWRGDWQEVVTSTCVDAGDERWLLDPLLPPADTTEVWDRLAERPPDAGAMLQAQQQPQLPVVSERAYIETPSTCDTFVTRGVISQQPVAEQKQQAMVATLEVSSERWERMA